MAAANSINETTTGITGFTGTAFTGTAVTAHAVIVGGSTTSTLANVGPTATAGQVLQSAGAAADPTFSTPTYPSTSGTSGKVLISDGTNNVYSTPTFPNASATSGKFIQSDGTNWIASTPTLPTSAGTSGKVLQSNGTNYVESTPTYPSASGSAGKILRADGTNNVYSTATYPDTAGTSGNVLTSDGTNWSSSAPASTGILTTSINLTNSQIKNLRATPQQIIAGQGAGKIVVPLYILLQLNYGGTNAFTTTSVTLSITAGTSASNIILSGLPLTWLGATANELGAANNVSISFIAPTSWDNVAIYFNNTGSAEVTGNAANNNTAKVTMFYQVLTY